MFSYPSRFKNRNLNQNHNHHRLELSYPIHLCSMLQRFPTLMLGFLLLGSTMMPLQSTASKPSPTINSSLDAKTIAQQRRSTQSGRNPAQAIAPAEMTRAAIRKAREWGLPVQVLPQTRSQKTRWATGCENIEMPYACDPILRQGWTITVSHQRSRWVFRGETADDLQLIERTSAIETRLPTPVRNEIKRIAGNHLQLPSNTVLITKVEPQTFSDGCLGLGNLAESCIQQTIPGYRVTAIGKPNERQIYRISSDAKSVRTEAIAGLPVRTDELPTAVALRVFRAAQTDLKQSIANLNITEVEKTFDCWRNPTDPPDTPCLPIKRVNGWKVTVTNYQQQMTYTVNLNGTILSKQ